PAAFVLLVPNLGPPEGQGAGKVNTGAMDGFQGMVCGVWVTRLTRAGIRPAAIGAVRWCHKSFRIKGQIWPFCCNNDLLFSFPDSAWYETPKNESGRNSRVAG